MLEFHKIYYAINLYNLLKACQESFDLALTGPDAEQIIHKWSNLGMNARFEHIREASLGFDVDLCTDLDIVDLLFSLDDLQYLRYHFEVFSTEFGFGLTMEEMVRVKRLDVYLDTQDTRISYSEGTRKVL